MKNIDFLTIARRIKETRQEKGLTQEYLAQAADVNTSHISNIENGRSKISLTTLVNICNALDVSVDYILIPVYGPRAAASSIDESIMLEISKCNMNTKKQVLKIVAILNS